MSRYSSRSSAGTGCKVYVGGLTQNASKEEIEDVFERYGRLRSVFVARNPPGFAFIEFDDPIDAEDSVKALDGRLICGTRVKVELSHGKVRAKNFERGGPLGRDPRDRRLDSRDYPRRDYQRSYRDDASRRSRSFSPTGDRRRRSSYSRSGSRSRRGHNGRSSDKSVRYRSGNISRSRSR